MESRFAGKVVVVTGAASGIGLAAARRITQEGGQVVVVDRDREATAAAAKDVGGVQETADVGSAASVDALRERVLARFGTVNAIVNSAGILRWGSTVTTTEQDWDDLMRVNLKGSWLTARAFVEPMAAGGGGAIVNIASNMGVRGVANQVAYSASKGAVIAMTRSMAVDLGPRGIRVNCVNPGHISTPMGDGAAALLGLTEEGIRARYPLGRIGASDEVATAIAYLASDEASFVTGAIVAVDGGYTA
jgi:NAD(P)-dependent dehydrogenase (short-subunit alcohol dehydrogenase family)